MIEYIHNHLDEAVKLANFFQPDLAETLARQRKDYGLSDEFEAEFPIENLDDHAVKNAPVKQYGYGELLWFGCTQNTQKQTFGNQQ